MQFLVVLLILFGFATHSYADEPMEVENLDDIGEVAWVSGNVTWEAIVSGGLNMVVTGLLVNSSEVTFTGTIILNGTMYGIPQLTAAQSLSLNLVPNGAGGFIALGPVPIESQVLWTARRGTHACQLHDVVTLSMEILPQQGLATLSLGSTGTSTMTCPEFVMPMMPTISPQWSGTAPLDLVLIDNEG